MGEVYDFLRKEQECSFDAYQWLLADLIEEFRGFHHTCPVTGGETCCYDSLNYVMCSVFSEKEARKTDPVEDLLFNSD